ncbi:hypothetical protein J3R82DRAFT_2043 [Butyriboletus roseoflavus]|nr:hypothetical protein J3R82DRAFT_2043 [Butyriboletus roseoflavus]
MSKTFSCDVDNCGSVFTKKSDLKKHIVEHEDPSKLLRCTKHDCEFSTLYRRGLETHRNSHSNARPYACPDMVKDPASSATPGGRSAQPSVSEKQCTFRSNCPSALLKHRVTHHDYKPNPRARRTAPKNRRAKSSPYNSLPRAVAPKKMISSNHDAYHDFESNPSSSAAFPPSPAEIPFDHDVHTNASSAAPFRRSRCCAPGTIPGSRPGNAHPQL